MEALCIKTISTETKICYDSGLWEFFKVMKVYYETCFLSTSYHSYYTRLDRIQSLSYDFFFFFFATSKRSNKVNCLLCMLYHFLTMKLFEPKLMIGCLKS